MVHVSKQTTFILCVAVAVGFAILAFFISIAKPPIKNIIIWTDEAEFASYAELFNKTQDKYKVFIQYKESPAHALVNEKKTYPDIVIAPWLKNEKIRKNFIPLDNLFGEKALQKNIFYTQLLKLGNIHGRQFLLPISFNLPAVIYAAKNQNNLPDNFRISISQMQDLGKDFNKKNKLGFYTAMGFSPRWNADFMYMTAKLQDADFQEDKVLFSYNQENFDNAVSYLRKWSLSANTSFSDEDDFQFKYFHMPVEKLVTDEIILFAYILSNQLFILPSEKLTNINFSWIHENDKIPLLDKLIYLGVHKKSKNKEGAYIFVTWFLNEKNQREMLERTISMNLLSKPFGIAGGFSSIKTVNEEVFPLFYPLLKGHLPTLELLQPPNILPARWEEIKERIIFPYISECVLSASHKEIVPLDRRITEWLKQQN